ncbi:MAG: VOC family protein [Alphaproteobacteria bacterium]|nr:VOC family protein [Alphaproteobacteria bacterium]
MRIDHLVWYNSDLAEGRRYFAGHMDCEPLYGGEHPGEGTANAVMALGPTTYVEILGRDVNQAGCDLDPEVGSLIGSGLYHWAIGGIDLSRLKETARKAGLRGGELVPGGRIRPDGTRLSWTCWGLRDHPFGSLIPFFIDWMDSEHPALSAPVGGQLKTFEVVTPEAEGLRGIFHALQLGIPVREGNAQGIIASIESSKGVTELHSFSPLPRGYVI